MQDNKCCLQCHVCCSMVGLKFINGSYTNDLSVKAVSHFAIQKRLQVDQQIMYIAEKNPSHVFSWHLRLNFIPFVGIWKDLKLGFNSEGYCVCKDWWWDTGLAQRNNGQPRSVASDNEASPVFFSWMLTLVQQNRLMWKLNERFIQASDMLCFGLS